MSTSRTRAAEGLPAPPRTGDGRLPVVPLYSQIARTLQNRVYHGVYRPGEAIPSESELSREFGVTRVTIRQAIGELRQQGVLYARRGVGTYVDEDGITPRPVNFIGYLDDVVLQAHLLGSIVRRVGEIPSPRIVRERLGLGARAPVLLVERTRYAHGDPVFHWLNYLPSALAARIPKQEAAGRSITELLPKYCGLHITGASQSFTAVAAPGRIAGFLGLAPGAPVLHSEVVMYAGAAPVFLSVGYFRPDRALYTATLTPQPAAYQALPGGARSRRTRSGGMATIGSTQQTAEAIRRADRGV